VFIGASVRPWLGLGVGYSRDDVFALSSDDTLVDGDEPDLESITFHLEAVSVLAAVYPSPASPWYGFVTLGLATLDVQSSDDGTDLPLLGMISKLSGVDPRGFVLTGGGGYDFWLNDVWTAGVSARLVGAWLSGDDAGSREDVRVIMPTVALTLGYH
jgi:hypothetical protein